MAEAIINGTEVVVHGPRKRVCNWCGSAEIKRGVRNPGWARSREGDWYCSLTHRNVGVAELKKLAVPKEEKEEKEEPKRNAAALLTEQDVPSRRRHAGRSAKGKAKITISLTEAERDALEEIADEHLRSIAGHATWIVLREIEEAKR